MSSRKESERAKLLQEKCQTLLTQMLRDEDNKYCVDCDAKGPRWASWNLGVFLCIRCAGIHRNLGVHISRVKSVNLDSWTPEQVVSLQQMGNSRARAVYEAQLPDGFRRPQTDSALENFIRAKYEHKKYLAREWVQPPPPKVDWAKEIDEEIEKQKRKKKATQSSNSLGIVAPLGDHKKSSTSGGIKSPIPAPLPKPKSSNSPKINRSEVNQTNSDLLGLSSPTNSSSGGGGGNNGDGATKIANDLQVDSFSGFLSAPVVSAAPVNGTSNNNVSSSTSDNKDLSGAANELAKEEADFFSQSNVNTSIGEKEKGKLTKDSILALYGTVPSNSIGQFSNNPLVGFSNQFSGSQTAGQFIPMVAPNQQPQAFPTLVSAASAIVPPPQAQFGALSTNLNLNLAGMPPGFLGPPQPHPQTQFMTPPNSTTMYSAPVMTAPGAFTSAVPQQIMPQPTFAQFPPQAFGSIPAAFGSSISSVGPTGVPSTAQSTSANLSQQFGNLNLGNVWQ